MNNNITIKSNVTLNNRGIVPPIDNMPDEYFDVRLGDILTDEQKNQKNKMMFWAEKILDENNNLVINDCYKGCQNCGEINNNCKRQHNLLKRNTA